MAVLPAQRLRSQSAPAEMENDPGAVSVREDDTRVTTVVTSHVATAPAPSSPDAAPAAVPAVPEARPRGPPRTGAFDLPEALGTFSHCLTLSAKRSGTVLLCRRSDDDAAVVVKKYDLQFCNPPAIVAERDAMRTLDHPHVAALVKTAKTDAHVFVAMTAALGGPLYRHVRRRGRLDCATATYYAANVADALAHCHEWGVIHRDVKASNVVLNDKGRAILVDFGAAAKFDPDDPKIHFTYCGTPHCMAPEMVSKVGHGPGVDFWALGVLLCELASGRPPFRAENPFELAGLITGSEPDLPAFEAPIVGAIVRALLNKRAPDARRRAAEAVPGFGAAIWKASLIANPPPFSPDEGYLDWFHDTGEPPAPLADADQPQVDPWADF